MAATTADVAITLGSLGVVYGQIRRPREET